MISVQLKPRALTVPVTVTDRRHARYPARFPHRLCAPADQGDDPGLDRHLMGYTSTRRLASSRDNAWSPGSGASRSIRSVPTASRAGDRPRGAGRVAQRHRHAVLPREPSAGSQFETIAMSGDGRAETGGSIWWPWIPLVPASVNGEDPSAPDDTADLCYTRGRNPRSVMRVFTRTGSGPTRRGDPRSAICAPTLHPTSRRPHDEHEHQTTTRRRVPRPRRPSNTTPTSTTTTARRPPTSHQHDEPEHQHHQHDEARATTSTTSSTTTTTVAGRGDGKGWIRRSGRRHRTAGDCCSDLPAEPDGNPCGDDDPATGRALPGVAATRRRRAERRGAPRSPAAALRVAGRSGRGGVQANIVAGAGAWASRSTRGDGSGSQWN